jgi:3-oxoacyl-[acyl-carrier-protein] synthase-1
MKPLWISHFTLTSCLGRGTGATRAALAAVRSGLAPCAFETARLDTWVGQVAGLDEVTLPPALSPFDCRNGRLTIAAVESDGFGDHVRRAIARYGAHRVAVLIGTSSAGIHSTEIGYRQRREPGALLPLGYSYGHTHNLFSPTWLLRDHFGLTGPAATVSTACSSSAKVFPAAQRLIEAGIVDAALVGGVDSLCLTTLYGFSSLELTAPGPCRPYDAERRGISVAEGAAFALLETVPGSLDAAAVLFAGAGESSDAYHMSAPHPEGRGARDAMQGALVSAGLSASQIDYINLHGTATPANDAAEGRAVQALFGSDLPCSSTKGATGHALGAAGAIEAMICAIALEDQLLPASAHTRALDASLSLDYLLTNRPAAISHALTNSFGFGGSNCSLVLSRAN